MDGVDPELALHAEAAALAVMGIEHVHVHLHERWSGRWLLLRRLAEAPLSELRTAHGGTVRCRGPQLGVGLEASVGASHFMLIRPVPASFRRTPRPARRWYGRVRFGPHRGLRAQLSMWPDRLGYRTYVHRVQVYAKRLSRRGPPPLLSVASLGRHPERGARRAMASSRY